MGTPAEFRNHARQCLELAEQATRKGYRAMLLDLADHWLKLADQAERELRLVHGERDLRIREAG
jgi:hypothetical protein